MEAFNARRRKPGASPPGRCQRLRLRIGALVVALAATLAMPSAAGALPPPPDNPSDAQLTESQRQAAEINTALGQLSARVAASEGDIQRLTDEMGLARELAMKAAVDLQDADAAVVTADAAAVSAAAAAEEAQSVVARAQLAAQQFAAASFREGPQAGAVTALLDASSVSDLLQRRQLLGYVSAAQLDALGQLRTAQIGKANRDAETREALRQAADARVAAEQAKLAADAAEDRAVTAVEVGQAQLATLQNTVSAQRIAYQAAVNTANQLQAQRLAYQDWLVLKAAEEERLRKEAAEAARIAAEKEAARQAAILEAARVAKLEAQRQAAAEAAQRQAARPAPTPQVQASPAPARRTAVSDSERASIVIAAAKNWLGTTYAWGGGNASGPTRGIRDGGTADSFGDYNRIGFDCSGLTLHAYAQVGISLPHYSGYQYKIGARIGRSDLQPGDLLYWATNTSDPDTIHHVAIYLGNNQIVEARQSGTVVMISPMRWNGYIGATRPGG